MKQAYNEPRTRVVPILPGMIVCASDPWGGTTEQDLTGTNSD